MIKKISDLMLAVCCMFFIISAAVVFTLNFRPLYYADIDWLKIEETSGYPREVIQENYDALIDYNSMWFSGELEFPSLTMSEEGKIHFEEVKVIFVLFQQMLLVTGILCAAGIIWKWKKDRIFLKWASIFTVVIPVIVGILVALNWDAVFITFHKLCFKNDYWIFDPSTDPVIEILPDAYFMHCAIMILVLVILGSIICRVVYRMTDCSKNHHGMILSSTV
ncbi:MAG: TIGR01906 family membrane protein [Lachnospiraceae bacterium]